MKFIPLQIKLESLGCVLVKLIIVERGRTRCAVRIVAPLGSIGAAPSAVGGGCIRPPNARASGKLLGGSKDHPPVKLFLVGSMAAFHLAVAFGGAAGDLAMADPEITQVPGKVGRAGPAACRLGPGADMAAKPGPEGSVGRSSDSARTDAPARPPAPAPRTADGESPPAFVTDHRHLPQWDDLRSDGPCLPVQISRHFLPPPQGRGWGIFNYRR